MKTLGDYADEIFALESQVKDKKLEIAPLEDKISELKREALEALKSNGQTMAAGCMGKLTLKSKSMPFVPPTQWNEFYEYVHANKAYHLLQKRIATTAVLELLEGGAIDCIEVFNKQNLLVSSI